MLISIPGSWKPLLEQARTITLGHARGRKLRELSPPPLDQAEFLRLEAGKLPHKDTCHIIGSGWSLADSMRIVRPWDYVVGYNMAALSGMRFDAYFTERTNERVPGINIFYREMLRLAGVRNPYLKNLYERNATLEAISFHIEDGAIPVKTFNIGGYFKRGEEETLCRYLLTGGAPYFLQYRSSLLLLIVIYARLGFRNIVLHGHDLSGPYYFDVAEFELAKQLNPRTHGFLPNEIPSRNDGHRIDQTFGQEPRLTDLLPVLARILSEEGISLYVGSPMSPIASLIPSFAGD